MTGGDAEAFGVALWGGGEEGETGFTAAVAAGDFAGVEAGGAGLWCDE